MSQLLTRVIRSRRFARAARARARSRWLTAPVISVLCALSATSSACSGPAIELLDRKLNAPDAGRDDSKQVRPPVFTHDAWVPEAGSGADPGGDPSSTDSDGDGWTDAEEIFLGTNPMGEGGSCAYGSYSAVQRKRAVDIMLVVDNSSSMDAYIKAIVARISQDFAAILEQAEVDYRVIVISRHGSIGHDSGNECDDHGICIEPPLSSAPCNPNAPPNETERFKQYSVCIDSHDAFTKLRQAFDGTEPSRYFSAPRKLAPVGSGAGGFQKWLRDGAFRTFVLVSDDDSGTRDTEFVNWLYSVDARYFGTAASPNWRFHSIVNLAENPDDPYTAWPPAAGLIERGCWDNTNRWTGNDYQRLSMQSGGLRFPYCRSDNYDAVFRSVAASVTESAMLPCTFSPAKTETGGTPDFSRLLVVYESGRFKRTLTRVAKPESCAQDGFYVVDNEIRLCPVVCGEVASDREAKITTLVACFDEATCGDGDLDAGETCDDGNRADDDGCDALCRIEIE